MSNYLLLDGTSGKVLIDPSLFGVVLDPCQISSTWGTINEHVIGFFEQWASVQERLGGIGPKPAIEAEELLAQEISTSAPRVEIKGGVAGKPTIAMDGMGAFVIKTPSYSEHLVSILSPRPNGILVDPTNHGLGFLITDSGQRIICDPNPALSPLDLPNQVTSDSMSEFELGSAALATKMHVPMDFFATNTYPVLSIASLEIRGAIQERSATVPISTIGLVTQKALTPEEARGTILIKDAVPHQSISQIITRVVEVMERVNQVTNKPAIWAEHLAAIKSQGAARMEILNRATAQSVMRLEHMIGFTALTMELVERLESVKSAPRVPLSFYGQVVPRFPVLMEYRTALKISDPEIEIEIGHRGAAGITAIIEHLGGIGPKVIARQEFRGTISRTTPEPVEHLAAEQIKALPPPVEHLGAIGPKAKVPENSTGQFQIKQVVADEFRTFLERVSPVALQVLTSVAEKAIPPAEHIGTIRGQTPARAEFKATVVTKTAAIPEASAGAIAARAAAVIEELVRVQVKQTGRAEFKGSLVVEAKMGVTAGSILQATKFPMVAEITLMVTRQAASPIEFYGWALISSPDLRATIAEPSLEATDGEINLQATNATILLIGKID